MRPPIRYGPLAEPAQNAGQFIPVVCRGCSRVRHVPVVEFQTGTKNACSHCGKVTDLRVLANAIPFHLFSTPATQRVAPARRRISEFP